MAKEKSAFLSSAADIFVCTVKAVVKWREDNWDDLLALAGLGMIWYGIASVAEWVAWVVVGALVFGVSAAGKIVQVSGARRKGEG